MIVGTSLGGFYAAVLSARHDLPAMLVNPCLTPFFLDILSKFKTRPLVKLFGELAKIESANVSCIVGDDDEVLGDHVFTEKLLNGEYRVAMRCESWKMALSNTIDVVMKRAKTKKQFRFYMKQCGYDVKWEDNRKYITYTCPNGRRCRDNKLHEAKYRKDNMEYEFKIRGNESSLQSELAGGTGHTDYGLRPGTQLAGVDIAAETSDRYDVRCQGSDRRDNDIRTDGTVPAKSAENIRSAAGTGEGDTGADVTERDGRGIEAGSGGEGPRLTGWEAERADLIAAEMLRRAEQKSRLQTAPTGGADRSAAPDIVSGIAAVASIIEDEPVDDDTEYAREHVDSKALAEERERKEAHGIHMG